MNEQIFIGTQRFTNNGKWGAAMVMVAPFVSAFCGIGMAAEMQKNYGSPEIFMAGTAISGAAFLLGIVLLLIGREFVVTRPAAPDDVQS